MDCADLVSIGGPFLGLAVNALVQTLGVRLFAAVGLLRWVFVGFLAGLAVALEAAHYAGVGAGAWSVSVAAGNAVVYGALSYCYFHFVNLGETARRIRIMREIHRSDTGLDMGGILARYDAHEIVDKRLRRILKEARVEERDGRLRARRSVLLSIANGMAFWDRLLARRTDCRAPPSSSAMR